MAATATTAAAGAWATDGVFTIAGLGTSSGIDGDLNTGVLTPGSGEAWTPGALVGRRMKLDAIWYAISANDATTATITGPPADATYTYLLGGVPIAGDIVSVAHAMTNDGAATARIPPTAGTLASLDLAAAGGASPGLVVTGTVALLATTITGLENLDDSGAAAMLTVTATSANTTLNQGYICAGTSIFSGTVTGGGPACAAVGVYVSGTMTSATATGTSDSGFGVEVAGTSTGDLVGTSNSDYGVAISAGNVMADNITAQSTSEIAFHDNNGTLTESTGAAGVNLSVRRLDGGQALELQATTISDELKITYVSNPTVPLVI